MRLCGQTNDSIRILALNRLEARPLRSKIQINGNARLSEMSTFSKKQSFDNFFTCFDNLTAEYIRHESRKKKTNDKGSTHARGRPLGGQEGEHAPSRKIIIVSLIRNFTFLLYINLFYFIVYLFIKADVFMLYFFLQEKIRNQIFIFPFYFFYLNRRVNLL